jgi:hypothetical protein
MNAKHPPGPAMTEPSDTPDENERRKQDCRAKAAYCKFVADREPDERLRKYYTGLSAEWEKEANK